MALPTVAIVGRPNVGKSSLLNTLAGEMISIVEPTAGVTRDRVSVLVESDGRYFELIDTGGFGIVDSDALTEHVEEQIHRAINTADLVLFVVDIRDGIMPLDQSMARLLRKHNMKVILVANKADSPKQFAAVGEFSRLGFGEALCVSATNYINTRPLKERLAKSLSHLCLQEPQKEVMKMAIVGKRNAGKSSFINALAGEERVIVSEIPGTTRDAVDVRFEKDGKTFVAIDTAGVRKKGKMASDIEFYSYTRTTRSIKRADVVLFLIDSTVKISHPDKKLAHTICEEHKACILIVNKWDLAKGFAGTGDYAEYLTKALPELRSAPIAFTTATKAKNVAGAVELAMTLFKQATTHIPTSVLNKAIEAIKEEKVGTPRKQKGVPKIYYATQVAVNPVSLLVFVNRVELFDGKYQRFLANRLRELLGLEEVGLRLILRPRTHLPGHQVRRPAKAAKPTPVKGSKK